MGFKVPEQHRAPKVAVEAEAVSTDGEPPSFSLANLQPGYCVTNCSEEQKAAFVMRLRQLSRLKWSEIKGSHRHGLGAEKIARSSFLVSIPDIITEDAAILSFRCFGLAPMIGYRKGHTLFLVWIDPGFKAYKH